MPLIAAERGYSFTFAMGGFSAALLAAGLIAPTVGRMIDHHGGHRIMPLGSLAGALGLVLLVYASHPVAYFAVWVLLGVAMAASLYDPAFATLGRIFGAGARQPITVLTLAGGFASTVSWPATFALLKPLGWQGTYLVYAALLALVAAPLHAFALPRMRANLDVAPADASAPLPPVRPASGLAFVLLVAAFCGLRLHALGAVDASARDLPAPRHRRQDRGHHRYVVWARAGRGTPVRVHLRPQCSSAVDRALRRCHAGAGIRHAVAHRPLDAGRVRVCDHVRRRQRADHHRARRGAARAVRRRSATAASSAASRGPPSSSRRSPRWWSRSSPSAPPTRSRSRPSRRLSGWCR